MAAAGDDVLFILESLAVNRRIPHAAFRPLLAAATLPPSPALPRASPRLRRALVLRALDAALCTEDDDASSCSGSLLRNARKVLAYPDAAACFPHHVSVAVADDEARAAAAVAHLKRLLDLEWAKFADGIAGDRADQTLPAADHTKRDAEANGNKSEADRVTGAEGVQFPDKTVVRALKKRSLLELEWRDGSDDDQPARKRSPSPTCAPSSKMKRKWSEIETKTLLEGLEKCGIGKWKKIKLAYPDVFEWRSTVDLKDKFRNMLRARLFCFPTPALTKRRRRRTVPHARRTP